MDRFSQMALSAARMAEADSGVSVAEPDRVGAAVATGIGGLGAFEDCFELLLDRGPNRVGPFAIVQIIPNMAAAWVSMELGTRGPSRRRRPPALRRTWRSGTGWTRSASGART